MPLSRLHFDELETDLTFIGVLKLEEGIKRGAQKFIKNCKLASIKTHILSGDQKLKCLSAGYQTELVDRNFGHCDLTFTEEKEGVAQIKGLLEEIRDAEANTAEKIDYVSKEAKILLRDQFYGGKRQKKRKTSLEIYINLRKS